MYRINRSVYSVEYVNFNISKRKFKHSKHVIKQEGIIGNAVPLICKK